MFQKFPWLIIELFRIFPFTKMPGRLYKGEDAKDGKRYIIPENHYIIYTLTILVRH